MIGGFERVPVSEADQHPVLRARNQLEPCLEHDCARALASNERPGEVKAVLGQQFVEVVAGHAPRNAGEALPDAIGVPVSNVPKAGVDFPAAATAADDRIDRGGLGCSDGQPGTVVQQNVELFDIVHGLPRQQRVRAARVVPDHAAKRASTVRRGIRSKGEFMDFRRVSQRVQDDARLDACDALDRIDLEDPVHVPW